MNFHVLWQDWQSTSQDSWEHAEQNVQETCREQTHTTLNQQDKTNMFLTNMLRFWGNSNDLICFVSFSKTFMGAWLKECARNLQGNMQNCEFHSNQQHQTNIYFWHTCLILQVAVCISVGLAHELSFALTGLAINFSRFLGTWLAKCTGNLHGTNTYDTKPTKQN